MKIAKVVLVLMIGIVIQAEASCSQEQSSACKEFFLKSVPEQETAFRALPLNKQLELYRCGMKKRPPTIGLAYAIAERGDKIIPDLIGALRSEKDEWMQSAIIDIFRAMSIDGSLRGKDSVFDEIKRTIAGMKVARIKEEAQESLNEIQKNSTKPRT